ncbi:MAG: cytochrome b/b6 domain-containing protein [Dehalococcoidia bacterium]|nr:cytochrome b/b6 domain-containing protein [Dehalococcoidia bacterium]
MIGQYVLRFDIHQRLQHILMFSSFIILAMTGLPLKYHEWELSQWWIGVWGGVDNTRLVHRVAGITMAVDCAYHAAYIFISVVILKRPFPLKMVPNINDFNDAIQDLKYTFGLAKERPKFDRFSYREKFDYWAVFWGVAMMVGGGAILMFPVIASKILPNWIVPVALVAHSDEAILAIGWILIVHMFFAHLAPAIFPFNKSIFTGKMPLKLYEEEHPLEYERLMHATKGTASTEKPVAPKGQEATAE